MTEITFNVTESHAERYRELSDQMDVDVGAEFSQLLMKSIDETYRQEASR